MITPETFPAALTAAKPGDVLQLASGDYRDVAINGRAFDPPLRIVAADKTAPPVFNTLRVVGCSGIRFEGVTVAFKPTMTTYEHQNVVAIEGSKGVTFAGGKITSGMAINGIPETETVGDKYGTVTGWPLGRGVNVSLSENVEVSASEIWDVQRGLLSYKSANVRFVGNDIHDVRRTFILGAADDFLIQDNHLHDSKPWRWGETPIGDHGDYIALFGASGAPPMKRVKVIGNRTSNVPDVAILGFTFAAVDDLEIRGNVVAGTDHQGLLATDVTGLKLYDNQFTGRAQILLRLGTVGARGANNLYAALADYSKGAGDNVVAPSGYVPPAPPPPPPTADLRDARIAALEATLAQIRDIAIAKRTSRTVGPWDDVRALAEAVLAQ